MERYFLLILGILPVVILLLILKLIHSLEERFDKKTHAISRLSDVSHTRTPFLILTISYVLVQAIFVITGLQLFFRPPAWVFVPISIATLISLVALPLPSGSKKHVYLCAVAFLLTSGFFVLFSQLIIKDDSLLSLTSLAVALGMILVLVPIPFRKIRPWVAEFASLGIVFLWNLIFLLRIFSSAG